MESCKESITVQITEEEKRYLYYLFSSKTDEDKKEPGKFIRLFNRKINSFFKSGSK
ncbi:MAG: hypothetical protein GXW85_02775 [Clostridia bacterium]|nr:hypothetical protein [Clostridia bacterium]